VADAQDRRTQGMTLRGFLTVMLRRKWFVITVLLVTVAVVAHMAWTATTVFESYSKLLVSRGQQTTAFSPQMKLLSWEEELTSELETIQSAAVYQRAQEILDAQAVTGSAGEPVQIDPNRVAANTPGKSYVIHILYRSSERAIVGPVVQALTEAYRDFRTTTRGVDPTSFLDDEIDELETDIRAWEKRRAEFLASAGSVELPAERAQLLATRRQLEIDLAAARSEVAEREARVTWIQDLLQGEDESPERMYAFNDPYERGESVVMGLRRMIMTVQSEYFAAKSRYTESHPEVLMLRDRLVELRSALESEVAAYLGYQDAQLQAAWARVNSLQASQDFVDERLARFPDREAQLAAIDRTLRGLQATHTALVGRRVDAMTTRIGTNLRDVVILQDAVEPYAVRSVDAVRMAVVPAFALLVAIGLAFFADSMDASFRDRTELQRELNLPVLAEIERFK